MSTNTTSEFRHPDPREGSPNCGRIIILLQGQTLSVRPGMCAFFLLTAGAAANSISSLQGVSEWEEDAHEEKRKPHWAQKIEDDTTHRTKEFRHLLKRLKHVASAGAPEDDVPQVQYRLTLHWDQVPFEDHQSPKDQIQMMLFGTQGYLSPVGFTFVSSKENEKVWHMEGTWEGNDIGTVEVLSIGYDHGLSNSLFIEYFDLEKCSLEGDCLERYSIPLYRWLSSQRDDGSPYRIVWVHPAGQYVPFHSSLLLESYS